MLSILNESFLWKNAKVEMKHSVEIRYTYTVNTNGIYSKTKHFCVELPPIKVIAPMEN